MHSWLNRCSFSLIATLMVGALALSPVGANATEVSPRQVIDSPTSPAPEVSVEQTAVKAVAGDASSATIKRTEVPPFQMAGVTWDADATAKDVTVRIQIRTNGVWGAWENLETEESIEGGRPGSVPLWSAAVADGVSVDVQAASGAVSGVKVTTIDPGTNNSVTTARVAAANAQDEPEVPEEPEVPALPNSEPTDGTPTVVPMPTIISRSSWGAASGSKCDSPTTQPKARGVVVHHTAGSNTYKKSDAAALVRGYQSYHINGHGWCDIGYSFLVDRFGQIFEGRKGGVLNQVRAAHSGVDAVNQWATGISMMGHFEKTEPSEALKSAMVRLVGWRLKYFGANPKGTYTVGGKKYQVLNGHRDVKSTACPGAVAYKWLNAVGGLRDRVAAYTSKATSAAGKPVKYTVPTGVKVSSRTTSSLTLKWTAQAQAPGYLVHFIQFGHSTGTRYFYPSTNSVTIPGLERGTRYQVRVAVANPATRERLTTYTTAPGLAAFTLTNEPSSSPKPTVKNSVTMSSSGSVKFKGRGFGHGIGMSQYGAEGGARAGHKFDAILRKYYPGTTTKTRSGSIRVHITGDTTSSVNVLPATGLKVRLLITGQIIKLPNSVKGRKVRNWMINNAAKNKAHNTLFYRSGSKWYTYKTFSSTAQFEGPSTIKLVMPDGSTRTYRGALRSVRPKPGSSERDTVNVLPLEHYLRGVVPREMPSSWSIEALKAQSVAARTYAARYLGSSKPFDICDTTSCQVYGGYADETARTNSAIAGTKGKILTYGGKPALTQFSASSGGYTNKGSFSYLSAVADPWDAWSGNANHSWSVKVSAKTIAAKYRSVGTPKTLTVTKRNGLGEAGGRVLSMTIKGSKGSKTITGNDARWAFGLRSDWFSF